MKDFEPKKVIPAALTLIITSCQSEPSPSVTFTKTEPTPIVKPTKLPPTPAPFVPQRPFIPQGFDRLLPQGTQDELYDWFYKKVIGERYELKLLDFGKEGISAKVSDRRGLDAYRAPDFGRVGYPVEVDIEKGVKINYKRRLQLYPARTGRLEEDWIVMQHEINTSSQADRPLRQRTFIPYQKGSFFFVEPHMPMQDPQVFTWSIL